MRRSFVQVLLAGVISLVHGPSLGAQSRDLLTIGYPADLCPSCAGWNEPQSPVRIFGNTYYVGTRGLASILITSPEGHVLIDGGLPDSAPLILENVRSLGVSVGEIRLIVNSHAHFDHAGGIAAIQRATGARVAASRPSATVLESGRVGPDDPQHGAAFDFPAVPTVDRFGDGATIRVGPLALTAHLTPGHTPGGTTWSWESCEGDRCLTLVYADSQTPVSADGFRFSDGEAYPTAVADFERSFAVLETLQCDILITPHPAASSFWERYSAAPEALVDPEACGRYAEAGREQLKRRLETEAVPPL